MGLRPLNPGQGSKPLDPRELGSKGRWPLVGIKRGNALLAARGPAGAFRDTPPSPGAAPPNVDDSTDGARSGKKYGGNPGTR